MNIEWSQPLWLLLLPFVWLGIWWIAKKGGLLKSFTGRLYGIFRTVVCTVLVLAMSAPVMAWQTKNGTTVFVADRSASVRGSEEEIMSFLQAAKEKKEPREKTALLSFGKGTAVEQAPAADNNLTAGFLSKAEESGSEITSALQTAAGLFSKQGTKRIVLLSDGKETAGDAVKQAKLLAEQGIAVDVFPLEGKVLPEVQLTKMTLAKTIHKDIQYEIALEIDANVETETTVRLYKGNTLIAEEEAAVRKGKNRVVFSDRTAEGGSLTYRGEIVPKMDTEKKNNRVYAYTYITDVPHILVIEQDGSGVEWEKLLREGRASVERISAENAPLTMNTLSSYDGVILADTAIDHLSDDFLDTLEAYVRTVGGGLLVSGGEHAFAPGGYKGTVLEDILPVEMNLKTEGQEADLSMVMVIDRSGSMMDGRYGVTRIDMAKEATIRSLEHFQEGDRMGVIAFDSEAEWVAEIQEVTDNKESLTKKIGSIQADGGTSILPALQAAYEAVRRENTKQKHILLLTDGQAEQSGYGDLLARMQAEGITLSTVAVGGDADIKLLERLAKGGGGRYYFTDEFTDLPEIFAKETVLASGEFLQNRTFYPTEKTSSAILHGIDSVPQLYGYVGTKAKSRGNVILESDKEEPILAVWQYGLGRTAVWTSDAKGNWTKDWLRSDIGVEILQNTASWILRGQEASDLYLTANTEEENSRLHLEMPFSEEVKKITADVVSSDNEIQQVGFSLVSPGVYEGVLDTAREGAYTANVSIEKKDGTIERKHTGFHISYPREYDITMKENGMELLRQIAEVSGGSVVASGDEVFSGEDRKAMTEKRMQTPLLILFLLLFLGDIALHRFTGISLWLEKKVEKQKEKRKQSIKEKLPTKEKIVKTAIKQEVMENKKNMKIKSVSLGENIQNMEKSTQITTQKLAEAKKKRKM